MTGKHRLQKDRFIQLLVTAVCALQGGCSGSQSLDLLNSVIPAVGYELQSDISYGQTPRQRMDVYVPNKPARQKHTILFVYGGAWRTGAKEQYEFVGQSLSNAGHTVIIPDYRLYPTVEYPEFVNDIVAAADRWALMQGASAESALPEPIVLMGHSSGAHTAALIASDPRWLKNVAVTVTDLIVLSGPYDLPMDNTEVKPVFSNVSSPDEVRPNLLVDTCHPRTLLIHGTDDERVLIKHSVTYAAALAKAGIERELIKLEGSGHAGVVAGLATPLSFANATFENVIRFLRNSPIAAEVQPGCSYRE